LKRKQRTTKYRIWTRIFRFFFPKDFKKEIKKGMEAGKASNISKKLGEGIYGLGKFTRGKVDPEHKMKIGKQGRTK